MAECLCTPVEIKARRALREISCRCAEVADKLIELGELREDLRCDFILECFRREYKGSTPKEFDRLYEMAKRMGWL